MTLTQFSAWAGLLISALLVHGLLVSQSVAPASATAPEAALLQNTDEKIRRRAAVITEGSIIVPVANVTTRALTDTWGATRSEGRTHEGIDIMAPMGAEVRAAADGRIVKFFDSERGGITIYQFDTSERFVYYYAHLSRRAPGLAEGDVIEQGDVIGYVGMSGNAPVPHLHFEIQRLTSERHWWEADSMNPYPLLIAGRAPN